MLQWLCEGPRRDDSEAGLLRVAAAEARQVPAGDTVSGADPWDRRGFYF